MKSNWRLFPEQTKKAIGKSYPNENTYLNGSKPVAISTVLRGSLPKSGPLDFATKNTFPLFFVGEEALVGVY